MVTRTSESSYRRPAPGNRRVTATRNGTAPIVPAGACEGVQRETRMILSPRSSVRSAGRALSAESAICAICTVSRRKRMSHGMSVVA